MKKMICSLLLLFIGTGYSIAQSDAISKFFAEYENNPDITMVTMSGKMFNMLGDIKIEDEEAESLRKLASKITGLRLMVQQKSPDAITAQKTAVRKLSPHYEELASVRDKDMLLNMMIDERGGVVNELVVAVGAKDNFAVLSLKGHIDINEAGSLASMVAKTQNAAVVARINPDQLKIYPNPSRKGAEVTIEIPEELQGGKLRIVSPSGKEVYTQNLNNKAFRVSVSSFGAGIYIVKVNKGELELTKKLIVE